MYRLAFPILWIRGLTFTVLVPAVVVNFLPIAVDPHGRRPGGFWNLGWVFITVGALIYALCYIRFLFAGGTPAIFFSRHLRFLVGEDPGGLVDGLYRYSRNPMYVGLLIVVFGHAVRVIVPDSLRLYGVSVLPYDRGVC